MNPQSFTTKHTGLVNVLKTEVGISLPSSDISEINSCEKHSFIAIWDTGATSSCITQSVVKKLNLKPISITKVTTGGGVLDRNVYLINIYLPNKVSIPFVKVVEVSDLSQDINDKLEVLIGMDVISMGDFSISNKDSKTCFSFRIPSMVETDFVKEANRVLTKNVGRNDPCPCGSGKKFKNCHWNEMKN
ncbi:MAG TPA: SEC-C metal-binding domain-containing protein [Ignavibacteria bacterium]|nr:SEC-C metal-binding domain-containing protein [Ignavibacteria bacterium]HMR41472.1 SEC-C metal-binding domain-containing protein [Ignavibacteria bacterium]